jgi:S-disulfanyl-L-cysteine oxidoreductase SoxD
MFKLDHKLIVIGASTTAIFLTSFLSSPLNANEVSKSNAVGQYVIQNKTAIDGGVTYERKNGTYTAYKYNEQKTNAMNFGRVPTAAEIAAWDIDARPDGTGLPEGEGSVEEGDELYEAQCASCHGDFGGGGHGYPQLAGGNQAKDENGIVITLKNQRLKPGMAAPKRTVGTYWPKATTLFTYIRDAMPYATPKSLSDNEVYALTAYILAQNQIVIDGEKMTDEYVLNKEKLKKVVLPNNNGFYPNIDGPEGPANVKAFFADRAKNIGMGIRCMTNCKDPGMDGKTEAKVMKIGYEMKDVVPPYAYARDLPPEVEDKSVSKAEKLYNTNCKVCHATDTMGAPAVGDTATWNAVVAKGFDKVLYNAVNGVGGMPPKGGNEDLTPSNVREIVDFMINSSKKKH